MIQTLYSTASSSSSMPLKSGNDAGPTFSRGGSHFEAGLSDGKDTKSKVSHLLRLPNLKLGLFEFLDASYHTIASF